VKNLFEDCVIMLLLTQPLFMECVDLPVQ